MGNFQGLLEQLLAGTRFDNKGIIRDRMGQNGLDPYGRPIPVNTTPATPAVTPRANDPENMIRELRRRRQLEKEAAAAQALQNTDGRLLPRY